MLRRRRQRIVVRPSGSTFKVFFLNTPHYLPLIISTKNSVEYYWSSWKTGLWASFVLDGVSLWLSTVLSLSGPVFLVCVSIILYYFYAEIFGSDDVVVCKSFKFVKQGGRSKTWFLEYLNILLSHYVTLLMHPHRISESIWNVVKLYHIS